MKKDIFKKAHELTKKIIKAGDDYRATFRLCLSFVYSQIRRGVTKMVELTGTEKQVKWASDIRRICLECLSDSLEQSYEISKGYEERRGKIPKRWVRITSGLENLKGNMENETDSKWFIDYFKYATSYSKEQTSEELYDVAVGDKELKKFYW